MKFLPLTTCFLVLAFPGPAPGWDGFDADTTDLIEVIPDQVPGKDDTVTVRDYDTDTDMLCKVESVRRNKRTIELVVNCSNNRRRTLVMEGI